MLSPFLHKPQLFLDANATDTLTAPLVVGGHSAIRVIQDRYVDDGSEWEPMTLVELKIGRVKTGRDILIGSEKLICQYQSKKCRCKLSRFQTCSGRVIIYKHHRLFSSQVTTNWQKSVQSSLNKQWNTNH